MLGCVLLGAPTQALASDCADPRGVRVALTAGLGAGVGAAGALGVSGILAAADDSRDYSFAVGALAGIGVTTGLSAIYALVDGASGCAMVQDGVAWSIPITMGVVGSLLPLAVWGASPDAGEAEASADQALRAAPAIASVTIAF